MCVLRCAKIIHLRVSDFSGSPGVRPECSSRSRLSWSLFPVNSWITFIAVHNKSIQNCFKRLLIIQRLKMGHGCESLCLWVRISFFTLFYKIRIFHALFTWKFLIRCVRSFFFHDFFFFFFAMVFVRLPPRTKLFFVAERGKNKRIMMKTHKNGRKIKNRSISMRECDGI